MDRSSKWKISQSLLPEETVFPETASWEADRPCRPLMSIVFYLSHLKDQGADLHASLSLSRKCMSGIYEAVLNRKREKNTLLSLRREDSRPSERGDFCCPPLPAPVLVSCVWKLPSKEPMEANHTAGVLTTLVFVSGSSSELRALEQTDLISKLLINTTLQTDGESNMHLPWIQAASPGTLGDNALSSPCSDLSRTQRRADPILLLYLPGQEGLSQREWLGCRRMASEACRAMPLTCAAGGDCWERGEPAMTGSKTRAQRNTL